MALTMAMALNCKQTVELLLTAMFFSSMDTTEARCVEETDEGAMPAPPSSDEANGQV